MSLLDSVSTRRSKAAAACDDGTVITVKVTAATVADAVSVADSTRSVHFGE